MRFSPKAWMAIWGVACAALLAATPVRADADKPAGGDAKRSVADLERLLPDDTGVVFIVNFKQLLDAPLLKKGGALEALKDAVKNNEDAKKAMADLGLDPFKDIAALISAGSGDDPDKSLTILEGTFNVTKFQAKAEEVAEKNKGNVKIDKVTCEKTEYTVYEVAKLDELIKLPPEFAALGSDAKSVFVGVAPTVIVMAPSKEMIGETLARAAGKKKTTLKNKEMHGLLAKVDAKQTLSVVILAGALKGPIGDEPEAKEALAKLDTITGGVTVAEGITTRIFLNAKSDDDAKDLNKKVGEGLDQAQQVVGTLVSFRKELEPLQDVVKGVKATTKDKTVTISSDISAETIKALVKAIGQAAKAGK
jgi:hypothetical protein